MPVDFIVGAAIGAAAASTQVRKAVRRGLVYSVGGVLVAYDKLAAGAQAVAQSARQAAASARQASAPANGANGTPAPAPETSLPSPAATSPAAGTPS
jgi:hypothetical protein